MGPRGQRQQDTRDLSLLVQGQQRFELWDFEGAYRIFEDVFSQHPSDTLTKPCRIALSFLGRRSSRLRPIASGSSRNSCAAPLDRPLRMPISVLPTLKGASRRRRSRRSKSPYTVIPCYRVSLGPDRPPCRPRPISPLRASGSEPWMGRFKVGLVWAGSSRNCRDTYRSVPLNAFGPVLNVPNPTFYRLQLGPPVSQLAGFASRVIDLGPNLTDSHLTSCSAPA